MVVKRNYVVGIVNDGCIDEVNEIIRRYATVTKEYSSHMYFVKQPLNYGDFAHDLTFFSLESESEEDVDRKVQDLIDDLENLNADYVLRDEQAGKLLVTVRHGGRIIIKFDDVKLIRKGTFAKIDELKSLHTDFGFCKGFKPDFRPLEGVSVEDLHIVPEIIYIASDTEENLFKFRDYVIEKVSEIDPDLKTEFTLSFDENFI